MKRNYKNAQRWAVFLTLVLAIFVATGCGNKPVIIFDPNEKTLPTILPAPAESITSTQPASSTESIDGILNCGQDFSCFIKKAESCTPAKVLITTSGEFEDSGLVKNGFIKKFKNEYIVKGLNSEGKCIYEKRTISANFIYSEMIRSALIQGGKTEAEILQIEKQVNTSLGEDIIETEPQICKGEIKNIVELFNDLQKHTIKADCKISKTASTSIMVCNYSNGVVCVRDQSN